MKHPYRLSTSNIIFSVVAIALITLLTFLLDFNTGIDPAFLVGKIIGAILVTLFLAFTFSLLTWLFLGRKEKGGTVVFNVVLALFLLSQIISYPPKKLAREKPIEGLTSAIVDYRKMNKENPDSLDANYDKFSNNVRSGMKELIKTSSGSEKQVFIIVSQFFEEADSVNLKWSDSHAKVQDSRLLDYTLLDNKEEFEYQKNTIDNYIETAESYRDFFKNRATNLKRRLHKVGRQNENVKSVLKGVYKKDSIQSPVFSPYISAHIDYGNNLKELLEFLEKESGKWQFDATEDVISFDEDRASQSYDEIFMKIDKNELLVNELYYKMIEVQ